VPQLTEISTKRVPKSRRRLPEKGRIVVGTVRCAERRGAFRGNIPPDRLLPADKSVSLPCNGFPVEGN